jgi:cardiolipin synthase (CMP-forming)
MSEPILTVPNQITILRMAAAPLLVVLVLQREYTWALTVYVVAGLTDVLDGLIARSGHQSTTLGAFLDPIADKILLSAAFVALTWGPELNTRIPAWLTVTTLSRDAIILTSVTVINLTLGRRVFYPSLLGKLTTVSQILTAGVVLLLNVLVDPFAPVRYLFGLTLGLTVASALHYVYLASRQPGLPEDVQ